MKFRLKRSTRVLLSTSAAGVLLVAAAGPGLAHQSNGQGDANVDSRVSVESRPGVNSFDADLDELNGSGDSGDVRIEARGSDRVTVSVETEGVSPGVPHAQHLHIGGEFECPTRRADQNGDDLISTAEGKPAYGGVRITLTTEGDTSAGSALAVGRFPVADANGQIDYERTLELPEDVSVQDLRSATFVQHGITGLFGDPSSFDGSPRSSLTGDLPIEATIPASCGEVSPSNLGLGLVDDLLDDLGLGL